VTPRSRAPLTCFGIGMAGLGILALVSGDFAEVGETIPASVPGRTALVYASGVVILLGGLGLVPRRTTALSVRVLFPYLLIGFLLQLPRLVIPPLVEVTWEQAGELGVLLSGAWVLFATKSGLGEGSRWSFATGEKGIRIARVIFGFWLLPIGVSHFVYLDNTVGLVPAWLPFRTGWAYGTGIAHFAAGLGVLFSVVPRLAATLEAAMLGAFTLLVWVPRVVATSRTRDVWSEFLVSWAVAAAAWLVAHSFATRARTG
jgi:uncharacterized membrane protein